ncbi:TPA: hypothetical protein EYP37_10390 [Candidatus Poribacteria bacterium]|nr:hypothetical protein [Candidatus Poribacteria bacterium]
MRRAYLLPLISLILFLCSVSYGSISDRRWTSCAEISRGAGTAKYPSIISLGGKLILVWADNRLGVYDLFYRVGSERGEDWGDEERLTSTETDSVTPDMAGDMRYVYLVWQERIGRGVILFSRFDGNSWSDPLPISPRHQSASDPRIAVMMSKPSPQIFVFWVTEREGRSVLLYSTSGDEGRSWSFPRPVEESDLPQMSPDAASGMTSVYLTWVEGRQDERRVRFKRLGNPSSERAMDVMGPGLNSNPSIAVWEPNLILAWQSSNDLDEPSQVTFAESDDFGDTWSKPEFLTKEPVESVLPCPVLTPRYIWIFWQSGGESGWRIRGARRQVRGDKWERLGLLSSGEGEAEIEPTAIATPAPEIFQIHLAWSRQMVWGRSAILYRGYDTLPPEPPGKPLHFDFTAPQGFDDDEMVSFRWQEKDKTADSFDLFLSKDGGDFLPAGSTTENFADIKVESGHLYRLKVRAKDKSGNLSKPSPPSDPVFVDSIPPYVRILRPYPNTKLFGKVPIYLTCRDDNLSECRLYWGEGRTPTLWHPIFSTRKETDEESVEWDTTGLFGLYTLKLEAKDEVGHISRWTVSVEVDNTPPMEIKPGSLEEILRPDEISSFKDPAWSPDGHLVAYSSNESGVWDIWILDLRSGERIDLTDDVAIDRNPSWSPDGRYLTYQSLRDNNWDLWRVDVSSGEKIRLTDLPSDEVDPAWFPLGDGIAFASNMDGDFDIYLITAEKGKVERITDDTWDERDPTWSPNGLFLAYSSNERGEWDIVRKLMAPGGEERRLTSMAADETDLDWSQDGKRILFTTNAGGRMELFSIDLITNSVSRVSPPGVEASDGTWAPDGKGVVCQSSGGIAVIHLNFPQPQIEARITSPHPGDVIGGSVEIFGMARGKRFERYLLEAKGSDGDWFRVEGPATQPVEEEGFLGAWDVSKLEGRYTLRLTVFGSNGGEVTDSIQVTVRNERPKLTVIQPADGTIWKDHLIDVICQAEPGSEVFVNGSRATQSGSHTFLGKAWLKEGWNEILIKAIDPMGETVEFKTHVMLDTTPPKVQILSPGDFDLVKLPLVLVRGKLSEDGRVSVNFIPLPPVKGGEEFSYPISLKEGTNQILIIAEDLSGHSTSVRRRVIYRRPQVILRDETPPLVADPFPPEGATLSSREVEISLRLVDEVGIDPESLEVWFDGEKLKKGDYSLEGGRLGYRVSELTDGTHTLKLSVSDLSGNRLEGYTLNFRVDTTPALISIWADLDHDILRIKTSAAGPVERLSFVEVLQGGLGYGYTIALNEKGEGKLPIMPSQRSFRLLSTAFLRDGSIMPVEGYFAYENLSRSKGTRISVDMGPELIMPPGDPKVEVVLRSQETDQSLMILQNSNAVSRGLRPIGPICQIISSGDLSDLHLLLSLPLPRNISGAAIFRWDEREQTWVPLDAEFDPKSGRLRATIFISGPTSDLGRYALMEDKVPPIIRIIYPPKGGEVSKDNFLVTAKVVDEGSGVADVWVEVDGSPKPSRFDPRLGKLIYLPGELKEGMHEMIITARDRAGNVASLESSFFVGEFFGFAADPVVYPNPSGGDVYIRFMLTRSSDVTLRIYTPAGDLIYTDKISGVIEGEFRWDRRNRYGREVPPGVYLFSIEAKNRDEKLIRRGKLALEP